MKLFLKSICICVLFGGFAAAQAPAPQWSNFHGGSADDYMYSVQQTMDGGFIFAGQTASAGAGVFDAWMIKTNSDGVILWEHTYGGSSPDAARSVEQTADGGYIFAGFTGSFSASAVWLVKTDANGVMQWDRSFNSGGSSTDQGYAVAQTTDGGYIITGETRPNSQSWYDLWLVKTDANGNLQWEQTLGGSNHEGGRSVRQAVDGGYITLGYTLSSGAGQEDFHLIKTDANGNVLWSKTYGGVEIDFPFSVQQTSDSGYVLAGYTNSFGAGGLDGWLIKTDGNGNQQWDRTFGGGGTEIVRSVQQTADSGYIFTGSSVAAHATHCDLWVIKTDTGGNLQWDKTLGGSANDNGFAIRQTLDGGYVVAGATRSFGNGSWDAWLLKLGGEQVIAWQNPGGGLFSDNANWTGGSAPETGQTALFDSSYYTGSAAGKTRITITFDDIETTAGLTITDADILLNMQAHSYGVDHLDVGGLADSLAGSQLFIVNGVLGAAAEDAPVTIGGKNSRGRVIIGNNGFLEVSAPAAATLPTLLIGDDMCTSPDSVCGAVIVASGGTLFSAGAGLSNGVVNLRANSSWQDLRRVTVGETGKGYVQVVNAGLTTPELTLGLTFGSLGEAYVKRGVVDLQKLTVGLMGEGNLILDSAAICQVLGPTTIGELNTGEVYLRNAVMSVSERFYIGDFGSGELTIDSTSNLFCGTAILGKNPGSVGRVLVSDRSGMSGDSTEWRILRHLFAGSFGKAVVHVQEQGRILVDSSLYLGEYEPGLCSTFVSGVNSLLDVKGTAVIGLFGKGWIQIADTAIVRFRSGTSLGEVQSGLGDILLRTYGRLEVSDSLFVGVNGRGGVALENGGQLTSEWAAVGGFAGAFGSARIDGPGSLWINQGVFHAGAEGLALMRISDGGRLDNGGPLFVGPLGSLNATGGSFNSASLHVSNGGTFIDSSGVLQIGSSIVAAGKTGRQATSLVDSLFLALGATFMVDSVAFAPGGFLGGSGSFPFHIVNDGGLNPGDLPGMAGTFTAAAGYNQTAGGTLFIELGGTVPGSGHDRLVVGGSAQLAGRLQVSAIAGFQPQVGQTYEILTAGALSGTFGEVVGQGGLAADVIYSPTGVGITITSPLGIGDEEEPAETSAIPQVFSLGQNYPNPFNPETVVTFGLPQAEWVRLAIYDLLGREVHRLVDAKKASGSYTIGWDGRDHAGRPVASGVYIYRLTAGARFMQTRKMLLMR